MDGVLHTAAVNLANSPFSAAPDLVALEVKVTVEGSKVPFSFVSIHNDCTTAEVRSGQVAALLDGLKEVTHPVILAGDFNGELEDASMKLLAKEGWTVLDKEGGEDGAFG